MKMTKAKLRDARDIRLAQELDAAVDKMITAIHEARAHGLDVDVRVVGCIGSSFLIRVRREFAKKSNLIMERKWLL